jgi:hypothetical protein
VQTYDGELDLLLEQGVTGLYAPETPADLNTYHVLP